MIDLIQDPLDFFLIRNGVLREAGGRVCCTSDKDALPRKEENDSAIRGSWIKKAHRLGAEVALRVILADVEAAGRHTTYRKGDMDTCAGSHDILNAGFI